MIPYARQSISQQDIDAVVKVLGSDFLTQGEMVPKFEQAIADYCGAKFALATCNATAALHLACLALNITESDRVWTSPNSFVASANCALYCGADIDFVDIDDRTYNISIVELEKKLILAEQTKTLPKLLIVVHFAGQSCEMKQIKELANRYQFSIIEDASHALGAQYLDKNVGCCEYSDITIFSFHPVKMITTAEGGMLLTNNPTLAEKADLLRNAGIQREQNKINGDIDGAWYYQQQFLGYNYRMNDLQAALGLSQLNRLDEFVRKRKTIAEYYFSHINDLSITLPWQHPDNQSSWHLFVVRLHLDNLSWTKEKIFNYLREQGIGVQVHYIPIHLQEFYQAKGFKRGDFPHSESYYTQALSLPMFYDLNETHLQVVDKTLREIQ